MAANTSQPCTTQSFAIIGAGLTGRLMAWQLLTKGHRVTLYDAGPFSPSPSAAYTAAAMISPLSEVVVSERLIYDLGLRSLELWPEWLNQLKQQQTPAVNYVANGSLVIAHPQDRSELQQFYTDLEGKLGNSNNSQWLTNSQISELEPQLSSFQEGLYLPGEAYLDNRQLLDSLLIAIKQLGGVCHENSPLQSDPTSLAALDCDWVIDCRGFGFKHAQTEDQDARQLRGVRGEVLWASCPEVQLSRPVRLMHPRYKLYIVPKPGGQFIIGATEIESEDTSPISLQSTMELSSALYTLNPAFAEARIIESDVNLRPAFMDNLPHIDVKAINDRQQYLSINGLYRHGYLLAPSVLEAALSHILQTPANELLDSLITKNQK